MGLITQLISAIPLLRHRDTVVTVADQDDFVVKFEATMDALADDTVSELNTFATQANSLRTDVNGYATSAENSAIIANGLSNYLGTWSGITTYSKGQSVGNGSGLYYISKVNSNLNHAVTDTAYWLYSPINDKLDKNTALLTAKTTPIDADVVLIGDSAASNITKKLTWANLKATLLSYFSSTGILVNSPTSAIGYASGAGGSVTQITSKSTNVSINKPTGIVTTHNATLAAEDKVTFTLLNTQIGDLDTVDIAIAGSVGINTYELNKKIISGGGGVAITLKNISSGSLSENVRINFNLIKGAIS